MNFTFWTMFDVLAMFNVGAMHGSALMGVPPYKTWNTFGTTPRMFWPEWRLVETS